MGDITCTIHKMVAFIVIMMFSVCILFVAMTSVAYIVGYVYDGIFGNSILRLGHFIGRKKIYLQLILKIFSYIITYLIIFI